MLSNQFRTVRGRHSRATDQAVEPGSVETKMNTKQQFKPWQLWWLEKPARGLTESGTYNHVVETVSFPIPGKLELHYVGDETAQAADIKRRREVDATIMVRRVPGHPGTLEEVPVTWLASLHGKMRWVHYAEIHPAGRRGRRQEFPTDMLRYDHCAPVNFVIVPDQYGWSWELDPKFGWQMPVVARTTKTRTPGWTIGRWDSFLARCIHIKTEPLVLGGGS